VVTGFSLLHRSTVLIPCCVKFYLVNRIAFVMQIVQWGVNFLGRVVRNLKYSYYFEMLVNARGSKSVSSLPNISCMYLRQVSL
jgi:hypothetical protein